MTTKNTKLNGFQPARKLIEVSVGDSVRIMREFNELTQTELAQMTGIPLCTIAAIESDQLELGPGQSEVLARALKCTPKILSS